jgi:hypothetical protein
MDYFRRRREEEGEKMLADIYDLRVGDHWETRLLEMIEESAVFQLFWSKHSAQSEYCRKEWQHALKFEKERPRFIRPIYWTKQLKPASPPELKHIQFYGPVSLPTTTRARMRIRRLFRR